MKIKVAIAGYGNIGQFAAEAVLAADDMELVGIIRRSPAESTGGTQVVTDVSQLEQKPDVVILCTPSRTVEAEAVKYLSQGICTVDSFDIHTAIYELKTSLGEAGEKGGAAAVISAGWDPGSDSVVRALMALCAPKGITYTNFGPGMSMGHSVAAKSIKGVADALSLTIPLGTSIHRRMVYVKLEDGAVFADVEKAIKSDDYFSHDETHVMQTDDISALMDRGHAVRIERKAVSGATDNQLFGFDMKINNPALTAQIMISSARAAVKQKPGAYTLIEIPMIDFLAGDREKLIRSLV